jgi:type I restriction enzyme S subunit
VNVPIAPLREQLRVADVLDSYVTRLDAAAEGLRRVEANLKRYRASVLKAAVEGRLVPTEAELARSEGRDYEPASVLLRRILAERRRRWQGPGRGDELTDRGPDTTNLFGRRRGVLTILGSGATW